MKASTETKPCTDLTALYTVYSIPQAAALWCGVPEDQVEEFIQEATALSDMGLGKHILVHPTNTLLEFTSRAIVFALNDKALPEVVEDGFGPYASVPMEYTKILGRDLKQWMEKEFPNDKPTFLFGDIKNDTDSTVSAEEFQALQEECAVLKAKLAEKARPDERSKRTYLNIIGALLQCIRGEIQGVDPHPSFANQAQLIDIITGHFLRHEGLSESTLLRKFPEARRALKS